ncbi:MULTISPECIES: hypothetical protein [unclassified Nocardioides]|uniref:hypothetical protein n=1 Tax=unclassified Nocardioides TaxID=2615069 RepID=UPI003610C597
MLLPTALATVTFAGPAAHAAAATCDGQPATVTATATSDVLTGTDGPDVIVNDGFADVEINALGGNDVICTHGYSTVNAGDGDDHIITGTSPVDESIYVRPGAGDDVIDGTRSVYLGYSDSTPGSPDDGPPVTIDVPAGTVDGWGHDRFTGAISMFGGTGTGDTFIGSDADELFSAAFGTGRSRVRMGGGDDEANIAYGTVWAGPGSDAVRVGNGTVHGGPGDDELLSYNGGTLEGGPGDDEVRGYFLRMAVDTRAQAGTFRLAGGRGADDIFPPTIWRPEIPTCGQVEVCRVEVAGGPGVDLLNLALLRGGGARVDLAHHTLEHARVRGAVTGVQNVAGTWRADRIYGDADNNLLRGELWTTSGRRDVLVGRGGRDTLIGGRGRDECRGEVRRSC